MSIVRTWVVKTLAPILLDLGSCLGVLLGCSLRGADFLQILDGAANDSIISEPWAGGRVLGEQTKTSADSYSRRNWETGDPARRKQISASPSTDTRSFDSNKKDEEGQSIKLLYSAFAANAIIPKVSPNVAQCPEDLVPLFMFCQGPRLGGIGLKLMLCPIIIMC